MKQSIHVSGMTCNSCLAIVSKSIYTIHGVKDLKIDLEKLKKIEEEKNAVGGLKFNRFAFTVYLTLR